MVSKKRIRIAVTGLGRMGKIHLNNLLQFENVEVVAVSDPFDDALKYALERGIPFSCASYRDMLEITDIDSVVICSPSDTHADYVELAAKKGMHIFCEKPLDLSLNRVKEVLKVIQECKVKLMLGFNRRFDKEFVKVKELVDDNAIGQVHLVKITSRDPEAPPVSYIERSGGLFLDMTIHDFDMASYIVGKEVDEVYATGSALIDPDIGKAGDIDTAVTTLTFTDGAMAVIDNSRQAIYGYDQRLEVFGSKGMLQSGNNFKDSHKLFDGDGVHGALPLHFFLERYSESYANEIAHFVESLRGDKEMTVSGKDGLISLKIGLAAKKSLFEGRPVKLSEFDS